MSIRRLMNTAAGLALAAGAGMANSLHAQDAAADFRADNAFVTQVAAANLMEVRLGQLANTKAQTPAVKQFAAKMINDHTSMQQEWMNVARKHGAAFSARYSPEQQAEVTRLSKLSGAEFERAYMDLMVQDHAKNLAAFQAQANAAKSADVRELVNRGIPALHEHSNLATQIRGQVSGAVASNNPNAPSQSGAQPTTPWSDVKPEVKPAPGGKVPTQQPTTGQASTAGQASTTGQTTSSGATVSASATAQERAAFKADARFFHNTLTANLLQQKLGELAVGRAQNEQVKQYARKMVKEHGEMQDLWIRVASRNGESVSPALGPKHSDKLKKIQKANGKKFDKEYMSMMVQEHKEYLDYFQREGRGAHSADVRALADREIPLLWEHFNLAKRIGGQVDAKTNVEPRATSSR